eukprot:6105520-Alexandrium_andersonii.AAC.1
MVTFRAPGVQGLPGANPNPADFAELDLVAMPRRWGSALRNAVSDIHSPLNSDHYPVVASFR